MQDLSILYNYTSYPEHSILEQSYLWIGQFWHFQKQITNFKFELFVSWCGLFLWDKGMSFFKLFFSPSPYLHSDLHRLQWHALVKLRKKKKKKLTCSSKISCILGFTRPSGFSLNVHASWANMQMSAQNWKTWRWAHLGLILIGHFGKIGWWFLSSLPKNL